MTQKDTKKDIQKYQKYKYNDAGAQTENPLVSLIIPARNASDCLPKTVQTAYQFLENRFQDNFEIILVPNPKPHDKRDFSLETSQNLQQRFSQLRLIPHLSPLPLGKGAALCTGIQGAQGQWICFTDSDLPYDLSFFDQAFEKLEQGFALVTGNRRLPNSLFNLPVQLLSISHRRHRLGLWFNRGVRFLFPITTKDTQAGIKAFTKPLAMEIIKHQNCPGFLFDLEIFLSAKASGYSQTELPVELTLNTEKSTVRVLKESFAVAYWLLRLKLRHLNQAYSKTIIDPEKKLGIFGLLKRYRHANFFSRLFLALRWHLTPYFEIAAELPQSLGLRGGPILDLGCGHGLLIQAIQILHAGSKIIGIDHDAKRVSLARSATANQSEVRIQLSSLSNPPASTRFYAEHPSYSAITIIDALHYFSASEQRQILKKAFKLLSQGGRLLLREVNQEKGLSSKINRFYEKLATTLGFTQTRKRPLCFRSTSDWEQLLKSLGFKVRSKPCSSRLFADVLFICEKY